MIELNFLDIAVKKVGIISRRFIDVVVDSDLTSVFKVDSPKKFRTLTAFRF